MNRMNEEHKNCENVLTLLSTKHDQIAVIALKRNPISKQPQKQDHHFISQHQLCTVMPWKRNLIQNKETTLHIAQ